MKNSSEELTWCTRLEIVALWSTSGPTRRYIYIQLGADPAVRPRYVQGTYPSKLFSRRQNCTLIQLKEISRWQIKCCSNDRDCLRKHCGKRRKCWLPAFSPFPTMFSNPFFANFGRYHTGLFRKGFKLKLSNSLPDNKFLDLSNWKEPQTIFFSF